MDEKVKKLIERAKQGDVNAQQELGMSYLYGWNIPIDKDEALLWFLKAANQGNAEAQYCVGICYMSGNGVTKDCTEAVKWFERAAEQGEPKAQFKLGYCYEHGNGVGVDLDKAIDLYFMAASRGHFWAISRIKSLYCFSGEFDIRASKAFKGDVKSQFEIGMLYHQGGQMKEAARWYRMAAEKGYAEAQSNLGFIYGSGDGLPQDYDEAVK